MRRAILVDFFTFFSLTSGHWPEVGQPSGHWRTGHALGARLIVLTGFLTEVAPCDRFF